MGRQVGHHVTFLALYNVLMYAGWAVPNEPVVSVDRFPELAKLRDNWETIRDEAVKLFDEGLIRAAAKNNDWGFYSFFKSGWKRFYLKWYDDFLPSARTLCPKTVELLNSIPTVHGAMFAMLPAGGKLGAHRDPFAGSLRYHLGLVTPNSDKCRILVDGVECVWRDGQAFMFDETFIHRAENATDVNRIILFCDVERPMKYGFMTAINRFALSRGKTGSHFSGSCSGAAGQAALPIATFSVPMPSTPHSILSPGESAATPAGVPVMMMSPAPISTCCESFQMISGTLQISSERSPFCRSVPLTESQILPLAGWPIFDAGCSAEQGAEWSKDFPTSQGRSFLRAASCRSRRVRAMPTA